MAFTQQQLQKFADLIRIDITSEQMASMNIDSIIDWFDRLQQINTDGVIPMITPTEHDAPTRADIVTVPNIRNELLANAPDNAGNSRGYFAVPKVIDED